MNEEIVKAQREYFLSGATKEIKFRKQILLKLRELLLSKKGDIFQAFAQDFNKTEFDVVSTELGLVIGEIDYMVKKMGKLLKPKKIRSDLTNFPSKGLIVKEPYGVVLIMSPWNYPLQLSLVPLVGAIAAGNTVVLKPSNYSANVSLIIKEILDNFDERLISVVLGGREANQDLLEQKFDYIFFTGGDVVGRLVMEKASKYLTPISLELGGKSPCIIDKEANIELAAKRIVWGKFLNCGQTCVAPDYVYVHKSIKEKFINNVRFYINEFYFTNGKLNDTFPHIINEKHGLRIKGLIDKNKVIIGGKAEGKIVEPTVLDNVTWDDAVMKEEIFGPIMPILTFDDLEDLISLLKTKEKPLALYYFSTNNQSIKKVISNLSYGGGCINDVVMHLTNDKLPFGGVGSSGMGSYHGAKSLETFSHCKSILIKGKTEINVKYPPYSRKKLSFIETLLKTKKHNN